jgi:hypothetical protein
MMRNLMALARSVVIPEPIHYASMHRLHANHARFHKNI